MPAPSRIAGLLLSSFMFLSACGGGGESGGDGRGGIDNPAPPNPPTPPPPPDPGSGNPGGGDGDDPPGGEPPGGEPPGGEPTVDTTAPSAEILFPPAFSVTEAHVVTVRGTANDNVKIAALRVNGVAATSEDGFSTWRAAVPLTHGRNVLTVDVVDEASNRNDAAAQSSITSTAVLLNPAGIAIDRARNRAVLIDEDSLSILAVDLASGARSVLSNAATANSAVQFVRPADIVVDGARNRALVVDSELDAVVAVDLSNGARTVFSGADVPTGSPALPGPLGIAIDSAHDRALIVNLSGSILAVDLDTRGRTTLASNFERPISIAVEPARNRALVLDNIHPAIVAVDLDTGARTVLSSETMPSGSVPFGQSVYRMELDSANNRALVLQNDFNRFFDPLPVILAVDLSTGARTVFSDNALPDSGNQLEFPGDIVVDDANSRVLVTEGRSGTLTAVALATGARTVLADSIAPISSNALSNNAGGIGLDSARNRILVVDRDQNALMSIDLATGSPRGFSAAAIPDAANPFDVPFGMTIDSGNERALVVNNAGGQILAVDLSNGSRTVFSTRDQPSFPFYVSSLSAVLDSRNNRVLESTNGPPALLAVDLTTRSRTVFSAASVPDTRNGFGNPIGLALDSANGRLFVADNGVNAILTVNLTTGARTIFSGPATPNDVNPLTDPFGIALDSKRGRAIVVEGRAAALVAVSLTDGSRTILSNRSVPASHNPLHFPTGLTIDDAKDIAFVADDARVRAVDLVTGERVFF